MTEGARFKTDARETPLRTQAHQEGATLDIDPFSPAGHKRTDSVSGASGWDRRSAVVSSEHPLSEYEHTRGGRHDE